METGDEVVMPDRNTPTQQSGAMSPERDCLRRCNQSDASRFMGKFGSTPKRPVYRPTVLAKHG
jgi:hypothetical protein